jgi:hypothetical protein
MTSTDRTDGRTSATGATRFPLIAAVAAGAVLVGSGLWAMAAPESFFDTVATFEPYNQHLIQDIGAFQIGLGAVLLLSAVVRDGLVVALIGVGIGSASHVVSHAVGRDLGGTPAVDIPFFSILTVVLLAAGGYRWIQRDRPATPR